jgi:uncharacterized membrane protein (UPF0136 family)
MRVLLIVLGVIAGAITAWILNKLLAGKIENKNQRIGLQVAAYVVFILLGFAFTSIFSLRIALDKFIVNRIQVIEISLSIMFPNSNILETSFNTGELVSINDQIQQSIGDINTESDGFFEKLLFKAFIGKLSSYINTVSNMSDDDGSVTIKTLLYNLKDIVLDTASPYFIVIQIAILILFFIFIGIYVGVAIYIKKGGTVYNKSIVFGDISDQSL